MLICLISQRSLRMHKRLWKEAWRGEWRESVIYIYIKIYIWYTVTFSWRPSRDCELLPFIFITATCIAFCLYAFNAISTLFTLIYARTETQNPDRRTNRRRWGGYLTKGTKWLNARVSDGDKQITDREAQTHAHSHEKSALPLSISRSYPARLFPYLWEGSAFIFSAAHFSICWQSHSQCANSLSVIMHSTNYCDALCLPLFQLTLLWITGNIKEILKILLKELKIFVSYYLLWRKLYRIRYY